MISVRIELYMSWNFLIQHVRIGHGPEILENRDCKGHSLKEMGRYFHIYMCVEKKRYIMTHKDCVSTLCFASEIRP